MGSRSSQKAADKAAKINAEVAATVPVEGYDNKTAAAKGEIVFWAVQVPPPQPSTARLGTCARCNA